jgi:hypothetical protein
MIAVPISTTHTSGKRPARPKRNGGYNRSRQPHGKGAYFYDFPISERAGERRAEIEKALVPRVVKVLTV